MATSSKKSAAEVNLLDKRKLEDGLDTKPFLKRRKEKSGEKETTEGFADSLQQIKGSVELSETKSDETNLISDTAEGLEETPDFVEPNMSLELCPERPLFGGAISSAFPQRFEDASNIRQVPDHQEVFVDPSRDESLIFELLDLKSEVGDNGSASWFLDDLAREQDAEGFKLTEQSDVIDAPGLSYRNIPAVATTAVGEMAISKGRQGREAQNLVRVYVANLRLKGVETDVLVTAYEPILINPLSESANAVGSGLAVPASQSGIMPMCDVIKQSLSTFKVNDWSLFGSSA